MTDGGKPHRTTTLPAAAPTAFAPLRAFLKSGETDLTQSLQRLSAELAGFDAPHASRRCRCSRVRARTTGSWSAVASGSSASRRRANATDVRVVVRHDTWLQIAQGKLNPFDAFISGKLRVGGDIGIRQAARAALERSERALRFSVLRGLRHGGDDRTDHGYQAHHVASRRLNEFDTCMLTLQEANGATSLMILWNSRPNAPTVERIRQTQRLALAREAAFRGVPCISGTTPARASSTGSRWISLDARLSRRREAALLRNSRYGRLNRCRAVSGQFRQRQRRARRIGAHALARRGRGRAATLCRKLRRGLALGRRGAQLAADDAPAAGHVRRGGARRAVRALRGRPCGLARRRQPGDCRRRGEPVRALRSRDGLYRSTDGGATWSLVQALPSLHAVSQVAFAPDDPNLVMAALGPSVAVSTNAGAIGRSHRLNAANNPAWHIAIGPLQPNGVRAAYAAGDNRIWRSVDGGMNWQPDLGANHHRAVARRHGGVVVTFIPDYSFPAFAPRTGHSFALVQGQALAVAPDNPQHVYLATRGGTLGPTFFHRPNDAPHVPDGTTCNFPVDVDGVRTMRGAGEASLWFGDYSNFDAAQSAQWEAVPGPPVYWGGVDAERPDVRVDHADAVRSSGVFRRQQPRPHERGAAHAHIGMVSSGRPRNRRMQAHERAWNHLHVHVDPYGTVLASPRFDLKLKVPTDVPSPYNETSELDAHCERRHLDGQRWRGVPQRGRRPDMDSWARSAHGRCRSTSPAWRSPTRSRRSISAPATMTASSPATEGRSGAIARCISGMRTPGSRTSRSLAGSFSSRRTRGPGLCLWLGDYPNAEDPGASARYSHAQQRADGHGATQRRVDIRPAGLSPARFTHSRRRHPESDGDFILIMVRPDGSLVLKRTRKMSAIASADDWENTAIVEQVGPNLPPAP